MKRRPPLGVADSAVPLFPRLKLQTSQSLFSPISHHFAHLGVQVSKRLTIFLFEVSTRSLCRRLSPPFRPPIPTSTRQDGWLGIQDDGEDLRHEGDAYPYAGSRCCRKDQYDMRATCLSSKLKLMMASYSLQIETQQPGCHHDPHRRIQRRERDL